jgi:hypothetical protein
MKLFNFTTEESKAKKVEQYLLKGNSLTDEMARNKFHAHRLASIINRLRKKYNIETELIKQGNTRYAKYRML